MNKRYIPLLILMLMATIKLTLVYRSRSELEVIGWLIYSLVALHTGWAYWRDKTMLSPPNFDFKDGKNGIARLLFISSFVACYFIGVIWG
jgi:hypothetical protein